MLSGRYAGLIDALLDALKRGDVERACLVDEDVTALLSSVGRPVDASSRRALEALHESYDEAIQRALARRDRTPRRGSAGAAQRLCYTCSPRDQRLRRHLTT